MNPVDVYGIGTLAMDVVTRVDRLPGHAGFCVAQGALAHEPGGSCTNVLAQLARLGASCCFAGAVGDDALGREVIADLRAERVGVRGMRVRPGGETLHTQVFVDARGERGVVLHLGDAFDSLRADELNLDAVRAARVLYTDLLPREASLAALRAAHEAGVTTVVNLQVDLATMHGFGYEPAELLDLAPLVDVLAPCRDAAREFCGSDDPDACARLLRERGARGALVFTRGAERSVGYEAPRGAGALGTRHELAAPDVRVVDTTGAGDAYLGGLVHALCLEGTPLADAMARGTACAAHALQGLGARHCPTLAELGL